MDAKLINPFLEAVTNVMPQLGFQSITRGNLSLKEQYVESKGTTVLIGMTGQVRGNVIYNMTEDTARKIASIMMMGMAVEEMNEMVQSAISEMVNMLTANAAISFGKQDLSVDISPPSLAVGQDFKVKVGNSKFIALELLVDSELVEINISLER